MTQSPWPPARILIIDDDETTLQFFEQMLTQEGHSVRAVATVEAGLAEADTHIPDAVLLDLHMPLTDGLEGLRRIRGAAHLVSLPVAILTGDYFIDDAVAEELQTLGASIHFKPVWEDDLHRIVGALVKQRTAQLL
jgi:DNA-binding response OmpR family regulator